ncbi:TrfB-related DNA-binding protein [Acinetobacter variabilis]|uniref:TrfB-related DNA-binding protein n=1 Tax=Acinetobacter variabilis TaxID=70346 RepID=UPI0028AAD921|nr:TrfB-related DNA-binding protein [Acinetobacter variabilis]
MTVKRITQADWKRMEPRMRNFNDLTKQTAYAVLVEGRTQKEVAEEQEASLQKVNICVKRVREIYELLVPDGAEMEYIEGFLPPELAAKVRKMIEEHGKAVTYKGPQKKKNEGERHGKK